MAALATFLDSQAADIMARVYQARGLDPASLFPDDDVMGFNFSAALLLKVSPEEDSTIADSTRVVTDLDEQMRRLFRG